jgi:hypothetical protein
LVYQTSPLQQAVSLLQSLRFNNFTSHIETSKKVENLFWNV